MKIVAGGVDVCGKGKRFHRRSVEGMSVAFADLHASVAKEKLFGGDDEAVFVEGVAGDEEVGDAGFVFEGDEAVAFGGAGALAADDLAGDGDVLAVGDVLEVDGAKVGRRSESRRSKVVGGC